MKAAWLRPFFGLGFVGDWPGGGSWASLIALLPAWFLPFNVLLALTALFSLAGLLFCRSVVREFQNEDPAWFVWDEVCGMMLSVLWAPKTFAFYALALALFRLFDIWKP